MTRNAIEDIDVKQRRSVYGPVSSAMAVSGYALTWILALLLIPEYALRLASSWHHRHDASMVAAKPAYEHAPWVGQFAEEYVQYLKTSGSYKGVYNYAPFTVVDSEPFHSQYMNIDVAAQGIVRRSTAANCEPKSLRVWAFGGSTTFGIGVPDDMTWPSYLVEDMRKLTGRCVSVENFGVETMAMNQELIRLIQALKTGLKPDVVVFYDGANDSYAGSIGPGPEAYSYYDVDKRLMDQRHSLIAPLGNLKIAQLFRAWRSSSATDQVQTIEIQGEVHRIGWSDQEVRERAKRTLNNYVADVEAVRALADAYHFRAYFFWQPIFFYGNKPLACNEAEMIMAANDKLRERKAIQEAYKEAEERAGTAGFVSLVHMFDETKACLFLDPVHLGPAGNQMVASRIASEIMTKEESVKAGH